MCEVIQSEPHPKDRAKVRQKVWRVIGLCLLLCGGRYSTARAQNGRTSAGSSPTLEDGNGSQIPGKFEPRWRRAGEKHGLVFAWQDTYDFQGNPSGGRTQMGTVFGRTNATLTIDLSKLLRISEASIHASGLFQTGSDLALTYVGASDLTSSIAGTHTIRVNEYYWRQALFNRKLTIEAGQIEAGTEFGNQAIGFDDQGSAFKTWINNSLASGLPTAREAYLPVPPAAKPGLLFRTDPVRHLLIKAGAFSGSHSMYKGDENGTRFDLRNAPVAAVSFGWKTDDVTKAHPGVYKVGLIHNFGLFPRYGSQVLTHGNDAAFGNIGYALWRARASNRSFSHRGIDAQLSIAAAPRVLNRSDFETADGVRLVGLVPKRSSDIVGVGVVYTHFSRNFSDQLQTQRMAGRASQSILEVTYKIVYSRWLSVWPDFQYVWKPSGDRRLSDAPILGLRVVFDH
jgi:porin